MPYYRDAMKKRVDTVASQLQKATYQTVAPLRVAVWPTPAGPVPYADRMNGTPRELAVGEQWGQPGEYAWLRFSGAVPPAAAGRKMVALIDVGGEGCVFDRCGCPAQGLTNVTSGFDRALGQPGKRVVDLAERAPAGMPIELWIQATTNDLFGKYRDHGRLQEAAVAVCDERIKALYYDFAFLNDLLLHLPEQSLGSDPLLFRLYEAANRLERLTPDELEQARAILEPELGPSAGAPALAVAAIGHSHIDLAWLWPLRETVQKGARTFATALLMLERYPDYIFGASQPQLYQWVKDAYPALFEKIRRRVAEGRWETLGGFWVESDTNLPSGESLVRQMLYGKQFFRREFGRDPELLWLPDSFGFNGALPQIARKSGVSYFCTTKLSWNLYNQYPHHTFIWIGIDGSRLLAHLPPEGTYNSSAAPRAVLKATHDFLDKGLSDQCLLVFGIGDGGGGPGEEHLEWLKRERGATGLAPVVQKHVTEFFREIAPAAPQLRSWDGELYLERHQGTYTTQGRIKRYNRQMELGLRDLEFGAVLALLLAGQAYPAEPVAAIWREILLYQFHDILAGSAIHPVYQECYARYEQLRQTVAALNERAFAALAGRVDTRDTLRPVLVANTLSWERAAWLKLNGQWFRAQAPAMGYRVLETAAPAALPAGMAAGDQRLENDLLAVEFAADGSLRTILDKAAGRTVLASGCPGNRLAVYEDSGDAWDFAIGYADREPEYFQLQQVESWVDGPQASLKQLYRYGKSTLEQTVILTHGSRRIDFVTNVDWLERHKMLRTSFPVQVRNTVATCEIQFGSIQRPTQRNTAWEMAKYEVCAQKWVDLSDAGYGVALLNDCKYGHKVFENVLDLNLLRSPEYPDPAADLGQHSFTYSLYPHLGDHVVGQVVRAGYELNVPLMVFPLAVQPGDLPGCFGLIEVGLDNIVVDTVKQAEAGPAFIIRLYECAGRACQTPFRIQGPCRAMELVDLMEGRCDQSPLHDNCELDFGPFEIQTLKVYWADA